MHAVTTTLLLSFLLSQVAATDKAGGSRGIGASSSFGRLKHTSSRKSASFNSQASSSTLNMPDQSFVGCTPGQMEKIIQAATVSNKLVNGANSYLAKFPPAVPKEYTNWFGDLDELRYDTVRKTYAELKDQATTFSYDCTSCEVYKRKDSVNMDVYVRLNGKNLKKIYLCGRFWMEGRGETKIKTRAGLIVRAMVQFTHHEWITQGPMGKTAAEGLATKNPLHATMNAENYRFL
ncbi:peptidyl-lys metalloendopeptidase [Rhizoctonia solani 123E]|uniref:Peptidyl-lys metalloendopeptidase n=1 Tax=Rhizoctonia solani 123E TaxID=1423351 RepID=A0A074RWC4_9AGAM|nr:peptidyl-lys metalloendopeptidase [Rhizoctonia solani 123E]